MRLNVAIIAFIIIAQTLLYSLKYAPFDVFKALYNIQAFDKVNSATWVVAAVLFRRLVNYYGLNYRKEHRGYIKLFKALSCMTIYLTIGGFVNEMSGNADDPKKYMENLLWALLVFCYYIAVITIYCVKIYKIGRHS